MLLSPNFYGAVDRKVANLDKRLVFFAVDSLAQRQHNGTSIYNPGGISAVVKFLNLATSDTFGGILYDDCWSSGFDFRRCCR